MLQRRCRRRRNNSGCTPCFVLNRVEGAADASSKETVGFTHDFQFLLHLFRLYDSEHSQDIITLCCAIVQRAAARHSNASPLTPFAL